uniref:Uncharacterized protein n=1 Tax=Anguilla anguilla TaxID=7936 RepID=A0A0E9U7H4_ANGAN
MLSNVVLVLRRPFPRIHKSHPTELAPIPSDC